MENTITQSELQSELAKIYKARFSGSEAYRNEVWRILVDAFFSRWIPQDSSVLDVGCGYGEFLRNVSAHRKFGMDLNPSVRHLLPQDVSLIEQDCSTRWPLNGDSLDVVFSSNFFEHLPDKNALQRTLAEAFRCLKPGGRLIAMGPNIKYLHGRYWDFFDHHLALTEAALAEALTHVGFRIDSAVAKFLPYTMSLGKQKPPAWTVRLYLHCSPIWKVLGRQFLVIAEK